MKNINIPYILLIALVAVSIVSFKAAHNGIVTSELGDLRSKLVDAKSSTIEILNRMPEDGYPFQPAEGVQSFVGQTYDMLYDINVTLEELNTTGNRFMVRKVPTKEELLNWTERGYDKLLATVNADAYDPLLVKSIDNFLVNNANQRGQLLLYLKMKGIAVE